MKRIPVFLTLFLLINLNINCQTKNKHSKNSPEKEVVVPEFNKILDRLKVKGAILIYDVASKTYYSNDFSWAKTGFIPASTFKIPNSIIALETGVAKNDSTIFKWDGEKKWSKNWEKDLTLKEAYHVSCVPCYQEIARKIGYEGMKTYLKKLNYTGMVFDNNTIDNFWLEGDSKITQFQQIAFLKRLHFSELPISKRTESIVKNIMIMEQTNDYVLRAKTGLSVKNGVDNGWYVGYFVVKNKVYFFATNLEPKKGTNRDEFILTRLNATKAAFQNLKILN
ncbi:class D beta-lactamase [Flavobacterium sp. GT3P67]|uniref:class D beta-lactamase n=1 Tax=Flavobacterium sp. GT3P67 TaxID=2541722 RepID=UPI0010507D88|nr:class D beta-lactamase [Flavobacterium sp. GT3P67]TDE55243.1 class D beta-lactamase [Flavobacterium sp. GT3P67]